MRVLIACEFSGVVRLAFRALGHDAWSCDVLPAEDCSKYHFRNDIYSLLPDKVNEAGKPCGEKSWLDWPTDQCAALYGGWDLMIAHPPCRYLNHAGVRWLYKDGRRWNKDKAGNIVSENPRDEDRWQNMKAAALFYRTLLFSKIPRIAVENSEMHPYAIKAVGCGPDQIIQPWQFGHGETKATWLCLKNLPKLVPTNIVEGRTARVHRASPGPDRWKERSRTLPGIAAAMAEQWG